MYGQSATRPQSEGILAQQKDLPGRLPQAVQFRQDTAQPYVGEALGHVRPASAETYGRGLMSVSNKASEVNILNMPIVVVVAQQAASSFARYTPRILSANIPVPSQYQ